MTGPLLSVLICAVPSRIETMGVPLFCKISGQCLDERLEVLLLLDNKRRSIGAKRNAIQSIARGRFVTQIDDDDLVADEFVPVLLGAIAKDLDADLFVYDLLVSMDDEHPSLVVRSGIELENTEHTFERPCTRKPLQMMCYRRSLAQQCTFPDQQYGEDVAWGDQAWPKVEKQIRINATLAHYRWRQAVSEAS